MKNFTKSMLIIVASSTLLQASDLKLNASASGGGWLMNWEQESNSANRFGSNAIDVDYKIDTSLAKTFRAEVGVGNFRTSIEYVNVDDGAKKSMTNLTTVLNYTDLFDVVDLQIQYFKAQFEGELSGTTATSYGKGTGETDLTVTDINAFVYHYFGFGIRNIDYELPHDVYLVKKSNGSLLGKGFADITYKGTFYQLIIDNTHLKNTTGFAYSARYGQGTLKPSGDFIDTLDAGLSKINNGESILDDGDATFYEAELGYKYSKSGKINYSLYGGYRISEF